ncbi:hypothetical protein COCNU_09G001740 [Cocos nucifera]|uniref:Uncharacterized protein n=1 Tax=Cocos nucifera TaxID=13894 RepID=A0A8K0IJQ0_COCNU|nr:hypothetical protein COCNU_09G001740 [Cocos nucifera]
MMSGRMRARRDVGSGLRGWASGIGGGKVVVVVGLGQGRQSQWGRGSRRVGQATLGLARVGRPWAWTNASSGPRGRADVGMGPTGSEWPWDAGGMGWGGRKVGLGGKWGLDAGKRRMRGGNKRE